MNKIAILPNCIDCGKILIKRTAKRCRKCWGNSERGKNNPNYIIGKWSDNPNICVDCGKKISISSTRCQSCSNIYLYRIGKLNNAGKNNPLFGIHRFGKDSPCWIDGRSFDSYPIEFNDALKKLIRKRDKHICQLCYKVGKDIHHIDYNKENCKKNNLITLCRKCHIKTNWNRDYWYAYLVYIMENFKC